LDIDDMSLALRWTTEINRRLQQKQDQLHVPKHAQDILRGGGGGMVYRIPALAQTEQASSLFHAQQPIASRRGTERWGPNLVEYLTSLKDSLELGDLELSLALIYLDRASSATTLRSSTVPPLPFCTPKTVHRLVLTALIVSTQAIHGTTLEELYSKLEPDVSFVQLQHMVEWMKHALGDAGVFVSPEQMRDWKQTWKARFPTK
jgi:hypothetical protein